MVRVRIGDVAREAGVSVASVSRVLNGLPATAATAARVRAAAERIGYQPDARARSLKSGRSEQLSVMVADIGNPVYVSMIRGIEKVVAAAGLRLLVSSTGGDRQDELDGIARLGQGYADGLIISPLRITKPLITALQEVAVPVVVIGGLPPRSRLDNVRANSPLGVQMLVEHLVDQGRSRIAFINGPADTVPGAARARGFADAVAKYGVTTHPQWQITAADFTHEAGLTAASTLLQEDGYDAVLCVNDLIAVATMRVIHSAGLAIPAEIAIVGMDDTELAGLVTPSLTSVDLGSFERGSQAAEMLLARIADDSRPAARKIVAPVLRVRESSTTRAVS